MRKFLLAAVIAMLAPQTAVAVEGGTSPYLKGIAGFMSGVVPPQGFYLTNSFYYFHGAADAQVRGGQVELDAGMHVDVNLLQGTYVSDLRILGGRYAVGVAATYAGAGLNATVAGPGGAVTRKDGTSGFSDSLLNPITLGWDSGNMHWMTGLQILAPTGSYHLGQLSPGKNIWAFMPQAGATWFDPASGWDVSGLLTYVTMTRNEATDYQSGDILHFDWGIGWHFGAGQAWEIGLNGSVMQQLSGDGGTGALLGPLKAQSFGIGPAVSYRTEFEGTPLAFSAKWESDFSSRQAFGGDVFMMTASIVF